MCVCVCVYISFLFSLRSPSSPPSNVFHPQRTRRHSQRITVYNCALVELEFGDTKRWVCIYESLLNEAVLNSVSFQPDKEIKELKGEENTGSWLVDRGIFLQIRVFFALRTLE